jgi:hypothetical protein
MLMSRKRHCVLDGEEDADVPEAEALELDGAGECGYVIRGRSVEHYNLSRVLRVHTEHL